MQKLKESELRYRRLFEAAQDGILILNAGTGMIEDVNPFLIKMLGYSREEFVEKKLWEVGAFKDIKTSQDAFEALQKNGYIRYENLPLKAKDGRLVQVEFVSNVYLVKNEKVIQCNIRDITGRKQSQVALVKSEALLPEMSIRDSLTGLFSRHYLEETLERELLRASRKYLSLAIILLEVDNFKYFNDTYGHAVGDTILHQLGELLRKHVRGDDIACRYGGDEFILVLPDASLEVVQKRANSLSEAARKLSFHLEEQKTGSITLSLGIALYPMHGSTSARILKVAGTALYRAKRQGKSQVGVAN